MTETSDEPSPQGMTDEDLPEDLRRSDDNPLAEPLSEEETPDDLDMRGGKVSDEADPPAEDD